MTVHFSADLFLYIEYLKDNILYSWGLFCYSDCLTVHYPAYYILLITN